MDDVTITLINFDQTLILSKSDFSIAEQNEEGIELLYQGETRCQPYVYFKPLLNRDNRSQYDYEMLLFECYEDFAELLEQHVEEHSDHFVVRSRFALRQEETETLSGMEFSYPEEEGIYQYYIQNSIVPVEESRISSNPLGIEVEGSLTAERVEVPLVGSYLCPTD
ncbi:hypothetical protein [Photobacterium galatheae]|uniref:Uncharacterized protein n=1 Tax=Photobacterium galatheae TaxID=1654360 RepID=A0A066RSN6_9GAMM|nr:hypothetical protein [Photobacterium galatheae]KDM93475.1 hypothetical protein EA58_01005 [Photobacterium galatheae]MCM0147055.1 hypothetical protein [Photobacterium galatheae]